MSGSRKTISTSESASGPSIHPPRTTRLFSHFASMRNNWAKTRGFRAQDLGDTFHTAQLTNAQEKAYGTQCSWPRPMSTSEVVQETASTMSGSDQGFPFAPKEISMVQKALLQRLPATRRQGQQNLQSPKNMKAKQHSNLSSATQRAAQDKANACAVISFKARSKINPSSGKSSADVLR